VLNSKTTLTVADVNEALRPIKTVGSVAFVLVALNNALVFAIYGQPDYQVDIGTAFWIVRGVRIICFGTAEQINARRLGRLLEATAQVKRGGSVSPRDQPLVSMHHSLKRYIRNGAIGFFTVAPLSIIVGSWPFMRTFGAYVLPVDLLILCVVKLSLVHAVRFSTPQPAKRSPSSDAALQVLSTQRGPGLAALPSRSSSDDHIPVAAVV